MVYPFLAMVYPFLASFTLPSKGVQRVAKNCPLHKLLQAAGNTQCLERDTATSPSKRRQPAKGRFVGGTQLCR
jgi:hypothetical protein